MPNCDQHRRGNRELLQHPLLAPHSAFREHPKKSSLTWIDGRRIAKP
jgi:hypothetical protein